MRNTIVQSKIWVYSTAFIMSFNGGYVNSICLESILKSPVGYVTGNLTFAGQAVERGNFISFFHLVVLVFCFLIGSIVSGLVIQGQNLKIDRRYSMSLLLQFAAVMSAMILLLMNDYQASYFLALTMGMQNAMTTHYGSALIRTTHMTGTTTDLGILIGHWIKGYPVPLWKIGLYAILIVGFSIGAISAALLYPLFHAYTLLMCVAFYLFMMSFRILKQGKIE